MGDMAIYIRNLEIFLSLYLPLLTDRHKVLLRLPLSSFITSFRLLGILISNEDFPIFSDLHELITEKMTAEEKKQIIQKQMNT